jgi:hypothetical protein
MNSLLTGLGTVPNVYICRITLEDNSTESYKTSLQLQVLDNRDGKNFQWSSNLMIRKYLRVALIKTHNRSLSNLLKDGAISATPREVKNSPLFTEGETEVITIPISQFKEIRKDNSRVFYITKGLTIPNKTKDLYFYAVCYLDTTQLATELGVNLNGALSDYSGPVTSERVLQDEKISKFSYIFLKPDNKIYAGPVHLHNNVYMEGPIHTTAPHGILSRLSVENMKLVDNRTVIMKNRSETQSEKVSLFSNLLYSVNNNNNLIGLFMLDMKQVVIQRTKMGRLFLEASEDLFREFMQSIRINQIKVKKQHVLVGKMNNILGSPVIGTKKVYSYKILALSGDGLQNELRGTDSLKQIYLDEGEYTRTYQFLDTSLDHTTSGEYQFKVEIKIQDRSSDFINKKIKEIRKAIADLKRIKSFLDSRTNYSHEEKKLDPSVSVPQAILDCIEVYYRTLSYFSEIPGQVFDVEKMTNERVKQFLRGNYTPQNSAKLLGDLRNVANQFSRRFKVSKDYKSSPPKTIKVLKRPGFITLSKQFDDVINMADFRRSYDLLGIQGNKNILTLSLDEIQERGDQEIERFFNESFSLEGPEFEGMSSEMKNSLTDLQSSKVSYLSPLKLLVGSQEENLEDLASINFEGLNVKFVKADKISRKIQRPSRASLPKKKRKVTKKRTVKNRMRFKNRRKLKVPSIKIKVKQKSKLYEKPDPFVQSSDYLGDESKFFTLESQNYLEPVKEEKVEKTINKMKVATAIHTNGNKENYDLNSTGDFLTKFSKTKNFSFAKLAKMPMQFKALIASRSPGVKNNFLESEDDSMKDPVTKIATEIMFMSTQKLEILTGYQRDFYGNINISQPIWRTFDDSMIDENTTAIIRMSYTELPDIGLMPSSQFKLPVQNSVFIITGRDVNNNNVSFTPANRVSKANLSAKNEVSDSIMYSTNNVVRQKISKNPVVQQNLFAKRDSRTTQNPGGRY